MKKTFMQILSAFIIAVIFSSLVASAEVPEIKSTNGILIDMQNSMVLYEKNSNAKIQPSGFTKIVSALVVLENCKDLNEVIVASPETIVACDFSFGNMGILANEELSAGDLLYGMLLYDAAEAAELLAGYTFGDYGKFINAMNEIALQAGATDTVFTNAGGFFDENQHSTLSDIAKISVYAMKNTAFAEIVKKDMVEIAPTNKYRETRYLSNTNLFVGRARSVDFYSKRVYGLKTANMKEQGYGISVAFENSMGNFIAVVSGAEGSTQAHNDIQTLRQYTADGFVSVTISEKGEIIEEVLVPNGKTDHVLLKTADELSVRLPVDYDESKIYKMKSKSDTIKAPIEINQPLGKLSVSYNGEEAGSVDLIAYNSVKRSPGKTVRLFIISIFTSPFFYIPVILMVTLFVWLTFKEFSKRKKSRKRNSNNKY